LARIDFHNSTDLPDERLIALCDEVVAGWAVGTIVVKVRYSRGADFSGTCFYTERRIHINLGRHLVYPYVMGTHLARARTVGRRWSKPIYTIVLADGCQVVLFVFLHELYHLLVRRARRNTRQKESMCDRFAARFLVDRFGVAVCDPEGVGVPREAWDFQDLDGFVAAARDRRSVPRMAARRAVKPPEDPQGQMLLFPV
jgi:hypothetical protein